MKIKANDTELEFTGTLTRDGAAVDLTGCTVLFLISDGKTLFSAEATIVDEAAGTVSYQPGEGFPVRPGDYRQEWEVTFSDGGKLTFPGTTYNKVQIIADLNPPA